MTVASVLKDAEERMSKSMDSLHHHLGAIRTGRANPALFSSLTVDSWVNDVASLTALVIGYGYTFWRQVVYHPFELDVLANATSSPGSSGGLVVKKVGHPDGHVEEALVGVFRAIRRNEKMSAFLAPIVVKLRDITLIAVVLVGVVMMIVDMWQDLQD